VRQKEPTEETKGVEAKTKEGKTDINRLSHLLTDGRVDGWVWRGLSKLGVKDDALRKWEEKGQ
jgi:hypothetical protein